MQSITRNKTLLRRIIKTSIQSTSTKSSSFSTFNSTGNLISNSNNSNKFNKIKLSNNPNSIWSNQRK